jgi:amino acid transporter
MMGLGSIVGTGVFVSIGISAGVAGPAVILAIVLAAGVATCNAFSSAQLAANHPVSGGTYEYGYRYLNPILGFLAGWFFLLAMGRRTDMPAIVARLNTQETTPTYAVLAIGGLIAGLVLVGNIKTTWSFSAFNVLLYYAITNLAALQLKPEERFFPRWLAWFGLVSCLFLAFWVEWHIWLVALIIALAGLGWRMIWHKHANH